LPPTTAGVGFSSSSSRFKSSNILVSIHPQQPRAILQALDDFVDVWDAQREDCVAVGQVVFECAAVGGFGGGGETGCQVARCEAGAGEGAGDGDKDSEGGEGRGVGPGGFV
jgi:hypothetical protein